MTFKEKLVKLRKLKGLTQDEFAKAVGVSRQAVYKWESGQSYPEVSKLLEMKVLFNISIDDLLDENYEVIVPEKKKRRRAAKEQTEAAGVTVTEAITPPEAVEEEPIKVAVEEAEESAQAAQEHVAEDAKFESEPVAEEEESKKKVGFFGRLFGRK